MRIAADVSRCVGAGQCVLTAPDLFDQDYDGTVLVLRDEPTDDQMDVVAEAVRACPARAIAVA
jgi:ferredoxin